MHCLSPALRSTPISLLRNGSCSQTSFFYRILKYSSQNAQTHEVITSKKIELTKPSVTKWKRPPFMKNLFLGKFDTALMAFPEILDKEQVFQMESWVKTVGDLVTQKANSLKTSEIGGISDVFLQDLKDMGLLGRLIPAKYGGLDLSYTACLRLNEVLGLDWSVCSSLAAHEFFAAQAILQFGNEAQKSYYLPKLATGDMIGAFASSELGSGSDLSSIVTKATETTDGHFVLNGSKAWVTNATIANLFVVFAKTTNLVDPQMCDISVFIVEKDTKGLHVVPQNKNCLHGVSVGVVHFEDVIVPKSNLVGNAAQGHQIYLKCLELFRFGLSTFTIGALKALLDSVTNHIIHTERFEKSLADFQLVRTRLSRISSMIYGMESVSYFTAALLDSTEKPDITLESAALKIFNSEGTLYCLQELMQAVGSSSLVAGTQLEKLYRDAQGLALFDTPNDIVRLYIGLNGCKFVGEKEVDDIMKMRNRYFFPGAAFKKIFKGFRIRIGAYKFDQDIAGYIHPSLVEWGNELEKKLMHFESAVKMILTQHGKQVVETQIDPKKLADVAVQMYAWSAVLSRCSRSYCIGLKNCHHELRLAGAFCYDADIKVYLNLDALYKGISQNNESNHLLVGEQVIDCQGYFPEHPLKHNF